ncbi:hypothetical protein C5Y96_12190 [Blastopirellula marina]|uniref:Uncharacterized protein n=1 Tax=Blastopirellula marina TaxID=124 RepID=A0A2S8FGA3_9BACT|nr:MULTISPECIES: hypothetical protein [Pirellulaceae]PQO31110.1 hypothetical protein C5Y96_12190 [Blastopirellula marina]RCS51504.1 hypothetical protein DTL36_12200 [Bremerella cremea]
MRALMIALFAVTSAISLVGCTASEEFPKYPVTGTITYAGKPIESGSIVFDPVDGIGPSSMGGIENGEIKAEVTAGEKIVRISAVRTLEKKDQYGEAITESYIPDKYNGASKLRETISADGENKLAIELEK